MASHRRALKASAIKHADRAKARNLLANAIRAGKVERLPCFCCGEKSQAHHPDYSAPLDVVWLCSTHHAEAHKQTREIQRELVSTIPF